MKTRVVGPFALASLAGDIETGLEAVLPSDVVKPEFHDMSGAGINNSGGAWVAFGSGAALASEVTKIQVSYTSGQPLEFGTGANAGAAVRKFIINQGEGPTDLMVALPAGTKLWVRSLSLTAVSTGYITMNLMG